MALGSWLRLRLFPKWTEAFTGVYLGFHMQPYSAPDPFRRILLGSWRMMLTWGEPAVSAHEINQKSFAPIMSPNRKEKVLPKESREPQLIV